MAQRKPLDITAFTGMRKELWNKDESEDRSSINKPATSTATWPVKIVQLHSDIYFFELMWGELSI